MCPSCLAMYGDVMLECRPVSRLRDNKILANYIKTHNL